MEFDNRKTAWQWDLTQIHNRGFTDNVMELMISKLRRLPAATQEALKQLACLGDNARMATLAIVNGRDENAIHAPLWEAVRAGLIFRLPDSTNSFTIGFRRPPIPSFRGSCEPRFTCS